MKRSVAASLVPPRCGETASHALPDLWRMVTNPYRMTAYGNSRRASADPGHVGRPSHADVGGSLRGHHRGDVFRPDPVSLSDHVRRIGAGSASGINSASPDPDAQRRKPKIVG